MLPQVSQKFISNRALGIGIIISIILTSIALADFWHIPDDIGLPLAIFLEIILYIIPLIVILILLIFPTILSRRIIIASRTRSEIQDEKILILKIDYLCARSVPILLGVVLIAYFLFYLSYNYPVEHNWSIRLATITIDITKVLLTFSTPIYFLSSLILGARAIIKKPIIL